MANETEEFLKELEQKPEDIMFEVKDPEESSEEPAKDEEDDDEDGFKAKNRRERRLVQQNQRLREEAIASQARAQALAEAQQLQRETTEAEFLKPLEGVYGTDTPEKLAATNLLKEFGKGLYENARKSIKEEVLREFSQKEAEAEQEIETEVDTLEDFADEVEDQFGLDLSEGGRDKGYWDLLERLSRKDRDGNITEYADPIATAEVYVAQKDKTSSRAKQLASRSMVRSGSGGTNKPEVDATEQLLRDAGII
jgi:hypothetical protein